MKVNRRKVKRPVGDGPIDLQDMYLQRLQRLLRLRRSHHDQLNDLGVRLLDRSIFAAYCDCLDLGAGNTAQVLLRQANGESPAVLEKAS